MPYYLNPVSVGTSSFLSIGDGYSMNISWYQAIPTINTNRIAYHIYYSTVKENVFTEGVKYISIDNEIEVNLIDFIPGQEYFGAVRPVEYDPIVYNLSLLPVAYDNLRIYPSSVLRQDITATDLTIPLMDLTDFPSSGVIRVGAELIEYTAADYPNNNLLLSAISQRGYEGTLALPHDMSGYDGYSTWSTQISIFTFAESTEFDRIYTCQSRFEYPNYPMTVDDGYRQVIKDLLSTDLSASDEQNEGFPMYDYAGYHRTDPVQLLTGVCVGSYIGGQNGCIDEYGNMNVLRGMSLQDQNNQRQEMLLSVTGRPAVLLQRSTTGITCSCYLQSSEYFDDRCPNCFIPGTLVRTEFGYKPIETIKVGDRVLSHDGEYHSVTKTFENNYSGNIHGVLSRNGTCEIYSTPEHPFYALDTKSHGIKHKCSAKHCNKFIKSGDGIGKMSAKPKKLPSGNWFAQSNVNNERISIGTFPSKELANDAISNFRNKIIKKHQMHWHDAKNLEVGDWLKSCYPNYIKDINEIIIPDEFLLATKHGRARIGTNKFIVDEDFMWICGIFIAEGSAPKGKIQFTLHEKEIDFKNRIMNFFTKYGYNPKLCKLKNTKAVNIVIASIVLSEWFTNLFARYCYNKRIPEDFMYLPENKSLALIQGIYDGDGKKTSNSIKQTSELLALQMTELLNKFNKQPLVNIYKNNPKTKKGNNRRPTYDVSYIKNNSTHVINRKNRWILREDNLVSIKKIDIKPYNGKVYNLEVEGTNTYIVQNIVVHNCNGTKFTSGYQQYFNPRRSDGRILIRVGPADENTKMYEAGLESELPVDLWTLTIPTIKTRDVIILFDVDDNEEFRYEIMNVTRNNTIVGMEGGQKMRAVRIRKTDPAYQVRSFKNTSLYPSNLNTGIGFTTNIPPHTHVIRVSEKVTSLANINQTTSVSQGHSHQVVDGVVMNALSHSHTIILL